MAEGPLKTLFDNMQEKADGVAPAAKKSKKAAAAPQMPRDLAAFEMDGGDAKPKSSKAADKRMSVERIYQKKTQLEHILLRPDTYIGSVEHVTQQMWVMDEESSKMDFREISFVPGLYKIFDEIIVNAADNKVRDQTMDMIKIDIDPESGKIRIWNNGKGIPVVEHKTEKMYVPSMIFGHLLTSSNYDDSEKKTTGGRNGYGAKLCNIFSTKFVVETSCKEYKKCFKQTWSDNMSKTKEPTIAEAKEHDFTAVTYWPDLGKFGMTQLDKDTTALFTRRAYDVAASTRGVKVYLNGKRLHVKNFRDYMDLYLKDKTDEAGQPVKVVYEQVNPRWEVGITLSDRGFQQVSFVNSIATTKGGRHVDYVADQCVAKLIEIIKKKNKEGIKIMPFQVRNHLWVFVNCLIENPTFDSQTKENMTKQAKSFGSKCQLSDKFVTQVTKSGIVESVLSWMKFKAQAQLNKKCHASKHSKLKGIPKLDDANDAGTKNSEKCTLILTEGDSAKALAVAGLGVVGRDNYGVFPLRGKLLNVRDATHKQIMDNAEINNIIKILGLHFKESYDSAEKLRSLRYGRLMIMTDQDQDGSHIKGLLVNFVHHFWPNLLRHNFVEEFITPIVKVFKGKVDHAFYSLPEFEEWKTNTENWHTWRVKYYKGLGTSTSKEAKEYFSDMNRHRIPFRYAGTEDDASINLAFSKKKIEERKEWLSNFMEERKRRAEMGLPELYLYTKDTRHVTYNEFINRELILFSNMDNTRSIPSLMDGLKPGQRKVLFTCIKRNLTTKELKVAQLAGSVAEMSAYHHGEQSLMSTIINLAQTFVGSNNLNMLQPLGQFGTRLHGGKDAASPRYIFTMLSPLARHIINAKDDALLRHLYDDNQKIEPEWYCPILPMVLINGADGIGTGWSTKIPNYDIREVVANLRRMLDGLDPLPMMPAYKNFRGVIEELGENKYVNSGEVAVIDDTTIEITELPIRTWTQSYKEEVLEPMLQGTEKTQPMITDYKEYHTDTTVKFIVKMSPDKLAQAEMTGLHKVFKLQSNISPNMVLFDNNGCIKKYNRVEDIIREFFDVRVDYYERRKQYLEGMLSSESLKLDNIARFILEKIEGKVVIENKPKREIIQTLVRRGYDSDPVKAWKEAQSKDKNTGEEEEEDDNASTASDSAGGPDFNYILNLPMWSLTKERKEELLKQGKSKREELQALRCKTSNELWKDDLDQFSIMLDEIEEKERADDKGEPVALKVGKLGKVGKVKSKKAAIDTMPSPMGRRVAPRIDSAMKMKAEKALAAKNTKANKLKKEKLQFGDDGFEAMDGESQSVKDDGDAEPPSLAQRLNLNSEGVAKIKKPRKPAGTGAGRGRGAKATTSPAASTGGSPTKGKKGKKKNPWSDSEEDEMSDLSDDMGQDDMAAALAAAARDRGPRRAAASKAKYTFEEDGEEETIKSDDDDEFNGSFTSRPTAPPARKPSPAPALSDEDDSPAKPAPKKKFGGISDSEDDTPIKAAPKKKFGGISDSEDDTPIKAAPKKKFASISDSEDDDVGSFKYGSESDSDEPKPKPKAAAAKPAAKAPTSKPTIEMDFSDTDNGFSLDNDSLNKDKNGDEDLIIPKPAAKPAAKKLAAPKAAAAKKPKKIADPKQPSIANAFKPKAAPAPMSKIGACNWSDESDLEIVEHSPTHKAQSSRDAGESKPKKPKAAPKRPINSDSEASDEFRPKKKKAPAKKKAAKKDSDDDDDSDLGGGDFDTAAAAARRAPAGRAKAPVKYNFDDSEDEFDDY
ncbi:DNA topoisomerase 2-alpha-like isoform X1 [Littorina saxatilis]|uniref:DNA topoisomerase 2 n=1 Tax=Littorina saxatilis TaxID=31220 RepID=A0AAN9GM52_9CAEN